MFLTEVAELIELTGWTLHYVERLDPAEVRNFLAIYRGYKKVIREIEAGKFRPSLTPDTPPPPEAVEPEE